MNRILPITLSAMLLLASCSSKGEQRHADSEQQTDMPDGHEPEAYAPPVDISDEDEQAIVQRVEQENARGCHAVNTEYDRISATYNHETHTIIFLNRFCRDTDGSREGRLKTKSDIVANLRNDTETLQQILAGVTCRYEFLDKDGNPLYTFNVTKNDIQ